MYAIIEAGGKQHSVSSGDTLKVDRHFSPDTATVTFDKVLTIVDGAHTVIGNPYIKGASVTAEIKKTGRDKKVIIYKKRPRRVYEKRQGHRQTITFLQIKDINSGG